MAKESSYEKYIGNLKKREQDLRDDIEKQSTKLEKQVKTGFIIGLVIIVVTTVFFLFFRKPRKKAHKESRKSSGNNWYLKWIIESISMELVRQFWQGRKEKFKDS